MILILTLAATGVVACANGEDVTAGELSVVASFYPVADAVDKVGGRFVDVRNLTPAGVEPHDFELTSDDVDRVEDAAVVFYVGSGFQPSVAEAAERRDGPTIDVASGVLTRAGDPHFWLDPRLMAKAVDRIAAALVDADAAHASAYEENARAYRATLTALDAEFASGLKNCARRELVTAHSAFFYLTKRYGLEEHPMTGVAPDAEPDPQALAGLVDLIKRAGVTTVFYEELVPRDFAQTLAKEAGVRTEVLNPVEGLTKSERAAGKDYVTVMRANLSALTSALGCRSAS